MSGGREGVRPLPLGRKQKSWRLGLYGLRFTGGRVRRLQGHGGCRVTVHPRTQSLRCSGSRLAHGQCVVVARGQTIEQAIISLSPRCTPRVHDRTVDCDLIMQ